MHVLRSHRPMVASSSRWVAAVLVGWMAAIGAGGVDGGHRCWWGGWQSYGGAPRSVLPPAAAAAFLAPRPCAGRLVARPAMCENGPGPALLQRHGLPLVRRARGRAVCGVCMGMSKAQRALVDAALERLNERRSDAAETVSAAHRELPARQRVRIDWAGMPALLDPHSVTWRGSTIRADGAINTTSHAAIKETVNPRSLRKRAQVENFASMMRAQHVAAGSVVVDFGCGSGNLLLPLAHLFPQLRFVGVDLKPRAIALLEQRAAAAELANVEVHCGAIEDYHAPFDVAISLHACGPASDAVLAAALQQVRYIDG